MKKIKEISFDLNLKGRGIVNRDSHEIKTLVRNTEDYIGNKYFDDGKIGNKNFSFGKRVFYKSGKKRSNKKDDEIFVYDELTSKLKISSNCLREMIYNDDPQYPTGMIVGNTRLLNKFSASVCALTRGYLYPSENLNKTSSLVVVDAIQSCDAVPTLETCVNSRELEPVEKSKLPDNTENSDEIETTNEDAGIKKTKKSLFIKENVGDIRYSANGFINLKMLEIISLDNFYNRKAMNPDYALKGNLFDICLKETFGGEYGELGHYNSYKNPTGLRYGELAILLNNDARMFLIKEIFKRILNIKKYNNGAYVEFESIDIKLWFDDGTSEQLHTINESNKDSLDKLLQNRETFDYYVKDREHDEPLDETEIISTKENIEPTDKPTTRKRKK